MPLHVQVLTIEECPNEKAAVRLVRDVAARMVPGTEVERIRVNTDEEAHRLRFAGSPTILVNGQDIESEAPGAAGIACRRYEEAEGLPPEWLVEAAILRELKPRHLLFLCVENSARSQMAEGIARQLAPAGVETSSAGSMPKGSVNPLAIRAMHEIGIDISGYHSKGLEDIDAASVDAVVTLCAEEVCPAFLGRAQTIHWGFPNPGAAEGTEEEKTDAFRQVRDELGRRLKSLFRA